MNDLLTTYTLFSVYSESKCEKNLILDPMSCLIRLCLLQYKPIGTKLSVERNRVLYQEPGISQPVFRSWRGDCREDLHNLCNPLLQCIEWYPSDVSVHKFLYEECRKGLIILKHAYSTESTIHHTITHYLSIIEGEVVTEKQGENPLIHHLKTLWSMAEIRIVHDLLQIISENTVDRESYMRSICEIVSQKEYHTHEYIQNMSTKY